jgi:transposase
VSQVLYVGVDAHKATAHVTVMDESGTVIKRRQIPSSPAGVRDALGDFCEPMKAVLEASHIWGPMYDWLGEFADDVLLAHPAKVRAIADARIKTDTIDSRTLAHLLRANLIPEAYAPAKEVRSIKRVLRQRMFYVRLQTMLKNRIQTLLTQHVVQRPDVTDLFGKAGLGWLQQLSLPAPDIHLLHEDLELFETIRKHIAATDRLIAELGAGDPIVTWLTSLPGIGPFLSVLIRYEVDDMRRFRTPKKFVAYTGLIPATYASGTRVFHGRLTKQGNKWLRWGFIEAVAPAIRVSPFLRKYYDRMKTRRGAYDARVCTARKLAELVWTVWTEQRCYASR